MALNKPQSGLWLKRIAKAIAALQGNRIGKPCNASLTEMASIIQSWFLLWLKRIAKAIAALIETALKKYCNIVRDVTLIGMTSYQ